MFQRLFEITKDRLPFKFQVSMLENKTLYHVSTKGRIEMTIKLERLRLPSERSETLPHHPSLNNKTHKKEEP
jgi:hypothetical protein